MPWIYVSRIFAVCFIVLLHSASFLYNNSEINSYSWWVGSTANSLSRWAVPVFVMISGILLLDSSKKYTTLDFYKGRAGKILIPTIFWSCFYSFLWYYQVKLSGGYISIDDLAYNFITGKPYYHMWFMFMISGMYFFTPFIKKMISVLDDSELNIILSASFLLSAVYVLNNYLTGYSSNLWVLWFLPFTPYFVFGYYMQQRRVNVSTFALLSICAILIIASSFATYKASSLIGSSTSYFFEPMSVFVIPLSICALLLLRRLKIESTDIVKKMAGLSMGVYLVHPIFLGAFFKIFKAFTLSNPLLGVLASTSFALLFSFTSCYVISRVPFIRKVI